MKILVAILSVFFLTFSSFAEEKLLVIFLYKQGSPYLQKINNHILKKKYLYHKIQKNFIFEEVALDSKRAKSFINKYLLPEKEGVYFINPENGKLLYKVLDLSKPCRCANLINYFSRKLYKKGILPDEYLTMAEKLKTYQNKIDYYYPLY